MPLSRPKKKWGAFGWRDWVPPWVSWWGILLLCLNSAFGQTELLNSAITDRYHSLLRLMATQNYEGVLKESESFLNQTTTYSDAHLLVIRATKALGNLTKAKSFFEARLHAAQADARAWYGLGLYQSELNNYAAAVVQYNNCLIALPEFYPALISQIDARLKLNQVIETEEYLKAQIAIRPNSPTAHLGIGYFYAVNRQPEAAIQELDSSLKLDPKFAAACYYKSLAFHQTRQYKQAVESITTCLPMILASGDEALLQNAYQRLATNAFSSSDLSLAEYYLEQVQLLVNKSGDLAGQEYCVALRGALQTRRGRFAEGLAMYQQALSIARTIDSPKIGLYLANVGSLSSLLGDELGRCPKLS